MKRTLKLLSLMSVAAAGVAAFVRSRAAEEDGSRPPGVADHNVCRQLSQAMDRFEEGFGT